MLQNPRFQKLFIAVSVIAGVLLIFLTLNSIWDVFAKWGWVSSFSEARTITLSAQGETTITPDTARFSVSVVTRGDNPKDVQERNTEAMNGVISFLKEGGVEEADIKTINYNLFPQYDYVDGRQIPAGYWLEQTAQVTVREISKAGTLLSGAVESGANQVSSIQFFVDDPESFRAEARNEAFAKAREKAEEMARQAGVRLGKVVSFSESSGDIPTPIFFERAAIGLGGGGAPDVQPGSQDIIVTVTVTYEIQ